MTSIFLYGPLAQVLPGQAAVMDGFAIPQDQGCFPLAVARPGARLSGVLSDTPGLDVLQQALGGRAQTLPDGTVIYVTDHGQGDWNMSAWKARWKDIAVHAVGEAMGYADQISADALAGKMQMIFSRAASQVAAAQSKPVDVRSAQTHDSVEVLQQSTPHAGYFLTRAIRLRHPQFDGTMSDPLDREVFVATDAAIVLPYDPVRDRVLLVEQFRLGPFGRGDPHPWALEPVAGRVDAGEAPEVTARRECEEEAGLSLSGLEHIASHYSSPGSTTEYFHCYLGLCDLPDLIQLQGGLDSEAEDIRTHVLPYERANALLDSGEADNGPLILMLIWLGTQRARLRASA